MKLDIERGKVNIFDLHRKYSDPYIGQDSRVPNPILYGPLFSDTLNKHAQRLVDRFASA